MLENLPRKTFSAFVPDPFASREDLLKMLLIDFGVMSVHDLASGRLKGATRTELSYLLYDFLDTLVPLEAFVIVIIDEAQNMSLSLIEEIRILSDLHGRTSPLQVLFVGQLELREKLKLPEMRQVDQRVSVHCGLEPLTRAAVSGYVTHRLRVAGGSPERVQFPPDALDAVYDASGGVPRLINRICDRALHHSYLRQSSILDRTIIEAAILEAGRSELPGALRAAPSPPAKTVTPPSPSIAVAEPAPGCVDEWLTGVEVGPTSLTDGGFVGATLPAAVHEPRSPQWVLGSDVKTSRRRRLPYGVTHPCHLERRQETFVEKGCCGIGWSRRAERHGVRRFAAARCARRDRGAAARRAADQGGDDRGTCASHRSRRASRRRCRASKRIRRACSRRCRASELSRRTSTRSRRRASAHRGSCRRRIRHRSRAVRNVRNAELVSSTSSPAASFRAFHRPLDLGSRGYFRQVLIGPFTTRAEADADLERLHRRGGHEDARVAGAPQTVSQPNDPRSPVPSLTASSAQYS